MRCRISRFAEKGLPVTPILVVLLLAGLETKHFLADYVLQNSWIIRGKGDLRAGGGYAHAGLHVLGSLIVLLSFHLAVGLLAQMLVAEFVIHYAIDFTKATPGRVIDAKTQPTLYWSIYGFDQLLHHLTYIVMAYVVMVA